MMLTWMQRHKKYLVVTIWVSVIAFVGAGFVGWGAYDFNLSRASNVATVGDEGVSLAEFNNRYSQIYNYYSQISNGTFNEEQARALKLDTMALSSLVEDKLLLNFAKSLGLASSDEEVMRALAANPAFAGPSGAFDKELYYSLLSQNQLRPSEYEKSLANALIIDKLNQIFKFKNSPEELELLAAGYFMEDDLSIAKIEPDAAGPVDEARLRALWEQHRDDFRLGQSYEISSYFVGPNAGEKAPSEEELKKYYEANKDAFKDFAGKLLSFAAAKKEVAKAYELDELSRRADESFVELSSGRLAFTAEANVSQTDVYYPLAQLATARPGELLKPFEFRRANPKTGRDEEGFLIIRLDKNNPQREKSFDEARAELLPLYRAQTAQESLKSKAEELLKNPGRVKFIDTGYVSRDSKREGKKIWDGLLDEGEFSYFLMNVFNKDANNSYVLINDKKAIVYKIKKQRLPSKAKLREYQAMLGANLDRLKAEALREELIAGLRQRYPVKIYYKGQ